MGSYSRLHVHLVFSTRRRRPDLVPPFCSSLYPYLASLFESRKAHVIEIGGMPDHVHILAGMPLTQSVASVLRHVKAHSSRWLNWEQGYAGEFRWQKGYGAFAVSVSKVPTVRQYIQNQELHHSSMSFEDEYRFLLRSHGIDFSDEHLFEGE